MNPLNLARLAVVIALVLNIRRGLEIPFPPESSHEWTAFSIVITLGVLEATAILLLGSRRRSAAAFIYSLGGLGLLAAVAHLPMLLHLFGDNEPIRFLALALTEALLLAVAAVLKWLHERRSPPTLAA
jgi:hypothetical protein